MPKHLRHIDLASWGVAFAVAAALAAAWVLYPRPSQIASGSPNTGPGVQEIVYWTLPFSIERDKAAKEVFEARHSEYRVVVANATVRDATGDPTRFLLGVAGGMPPDVIFFDRFAIVEWAARGAFTDLSGLIQRDRDTPLGIRREDIFEPVWNETVYQGGVYAIGNHVDTRALYYLKEPLIRAGYVYAATDPDVLAGRAEAGQARPPRTWEELCRKRLHAEARVEAGGLVTLSAFARGPAVNEGVASDARPDLAAAGVRVGDVIALIKGSDVFRGRILAIDAPDRLRVDLVREQRPGLAALPVTGPCEAKIFDQDSYIVRLTRYDAETGEMRVCAFLPLYGNSWLYMYGWLNGAEFMSEDGRRCRLDSPEVVEALQYLVDLFDSLGGRRQADYFQSAATSGGSTSLDPLLAEKIVLRIDGDWFLSTILAFSPHLEFGVTPGPIPARRLAAGQRSVGWMGGWSYAIPATAKNKEAAWEFIKWLSSLEGNQIMVRYDASQKRAKGQAFIPSLHPNRRTLEWLRKTHVEGNPGVSDNLVRAFQVFADLLPHSRYRPVTPVGQRLWQEHVTAADQAIGHKMRPYDALRDGTRKVQTALDRFFNPPTGPPVRWRAIIGAYVLGIFLIALGLIITQEIKHRRAKGSRRGWIEGFICASPWLIGFLVFGAGPILFSIVISFCRYDVLNQAQFVGWTNYANLLGRHLDPVQNTVVNNDADLWISLRNTGFMVLGVPLSIIAGLALALLLDAKVRGLHFFRTIYYLPAIVPAVAGFILWLWIFNPSQGMLNQVLRLFGIADPPNWLGQAAWSKPSLILMGLWGVGGGMIIWIAGLKDIPTSLYESAAIDGAGRFRRFIHITLPLLSPYIFFNLIMGFIGVLQVFEAAYIMTDGGPEKSTLFYAYKLFNEAFRYLNMGAASAMAWILFVLVLAITLFQLWLGKKWVHYGG